MKKRRLWSNCCNVFVLLLILIPGLTWAGSISGVVHDEITGNPVQNLTVNARDWVTDQWHGNGLSQADGSYTIVGLDAGTYRLVIHTNGTEYIQTYYYNNAPDFSTATQVSLSTNDDDLAGYDFNLPLGGRIAGTVGVDPGGAPITGLTVTACLYLGGGYCGSAITDANGDYRIGGLAGGNYRVEVSSGDSNYVGEYYDNVTDWNNAAPVSVNSGAETGGIDFALSIEGSIAGTVGVDPGGAPINGLTVTACPYLGGGYCGSAITDTNGDYRIGGLAGGNYRVEVSSGDSNYVGEYYDNVTDGNNAAPVSVNSGAETGGIDFALSTGGSIAGTVGVDPGGAPITGLTVIARTSLYGLFHSAITDANGDYRIDGLAGGNYLVEVFSGGSNYLGEFYDNVTDSNNATPVSVNLGAETGGIDFALSIEGSISGTVGVDPGGAPITGLTVTVCPYEGGGYCGSAVTDANGNYRIGGLAGGNYRVYVLSGDSNYVGEYYDNVTDGNNAAPVSVNSGAETGGIDFALSTGGSIAGTVGVDPGGAPITGLTVTACLYLGGGYCGSAITDANGDYRIGGLAGGNYRVYVLSGDSNYVGEYYDNVTDGNNAAPVSVNLGAETGGIDFALSTGGRIHGRVTEEDGTTPVPYCSVEVNEYNIGYWAGSTMTDANGDYVIGGLPSGAYRVRAYPYGTGLVSEYYSGTYSYDDASPVNVTTGGDTNNINFTLDIGGTISGYVYQHDGTTPISGVNVTLLDRCYNGHISMGVQTNENGFFEFTGLPPGAQFILRADAISSEQNYLSQWYGNLNDSEDCNQATFVTVGDSVNFSLTAGATITGQVTKSSDGQPVANFLVMAQHYDTGSFAGIGGSGVTDANGDYVIGGLPAGTYRVFAHPNGAGLVYEYYSETYSYDDASPVNVTTGGETNNINFTLDIGGAITGKVTKTSDGQPVANVSVMALHYDTGSFAGSGVTDVNGDYVIGGLLVGTYRVRAYPYGTGLVSEYYSGTLSYDDASPVNVTTGGDTNNINFTLDIGGTISGYVYQQDGTTPISGAYVSLYSDRCHNGNYMGVPPPGTDANGFFEFTGLPLGAQFILWANAYNPGQYYISQWYDNLNDGEDCSQATFVTVGDSVNFNLTVGGAVSGSVKDNNGTDITGVSVGVDVIVGDPCGNHQSVYGSLTNFFDGTFMSSGIPAGTYYLRTHPAESNYVSEWWTSTGSSQDCGAAEAFTVAAGAMSPDFEFQLEEGGTITGQVTKTSDGQPVANVWVMAHHYDTGYWGNGANTDAQGYYTIKGLPSGDYRVNVDNWGMNALEEYYDDAHDWNAASRVAVAAGSTTTNINMALDYGFSNNASVMNVHQPNDTFETNYEFEPYGFVGTLPDDITSVTVETPVSHTIVNLDWDPVWNEFWTVKVGSPEPGVHVFRATTADGHEVIATDYQYVLQTIPKPDTATFAPAEGAVVADKTPSFTWDAVDLPGVPLYYRFEVVNDTTGLRVWASSRNLGMTSITLRNGQLSPGSYRWRVRVTDSNNWVEVQNRANSAWVHFTVPATLNNHDALPAIDPNNWNGLTWTGGNAFACSVMVTDLDGVAFDGSSHTLKVTPPDGTTFPDGTNEKYASFDGSAGPKSCYYWLYVGGGIPASGDYTFTVTDIDGNQTSFVEKVSVNPLSSPNEDSITPSNVQQYITATFDNVYVNGLLYETFPMTGVDQLDPAKWKWISEVDVVDNKLEIDLDHFVGRGHGGISFTDIEPITSVQADVTVTSVSDSRAKARIAGAFFNDGSNADVWVSINNDGSRVYYNVSRQWINHQGNWQWEDIYSGDLVAAAVNDVVTVGVAWNEGTKTLTFSANNQTQGLTNSVDYVHNGPVYPAIAKELNLQARINLTTSTTPTFIWDPVAGASRYRVRIYTYDNSTTVWKGYTGSETSYTVPPGVLEPDSYYRYRVEAWDTPSPLSIDNYSRTPNSSDDYYRFYTNSDVTEAPSIDLDGGGVQTVQSDVPGIIPVFWVRVSDRQGVPNNIASVKVRFPSGYEESLSLDHTDGPYRGYYLSISDQTVETGTYTFIVTDSDGHTATITDDLVYDPIGYPAAGSLTATATSKEIEVSWDPVPEAAFYQLYIYNEAYEQIYRLVVDAAEGSSIAIPRGLLEEGKLYRYQVKTYREFFSDITGSDTEGNNDNSSWIPWQSSQYPTFTLSQDNDGDGLTNALENATCTDPDDADSDDDGIFDGLEDANLNGEVDDGETDPCNSDTDGDGIQDGTEIGLTSEDIGPDTDSGAFIPDADPTTTTDPTLADSDGDGMSDGEEDTNHNGRVDEGEKDPNKKRVTAQPFIPLLLLE